MNILGFITWTLRQVRPMYDQDKEDEVGKVYSAYGKTRTVYRIQMGSQKETDN
jgi:hypothetical protein